MSRSLRTGLFALLASVLLVTGLGPIQAAQAVDEPTLDITVSVHDLDGADLDGIFVRAFRWDVASETWQNSYDTGTSYLGEALISLSEPGDYMLRADAPRGDYRRAWSSGSEPPAGPGAPGTFTFGGGADATDTATIAMTTTDSAGSTSVLEGLVRDEEGNRLDGIEVRAFRKLPGESWYVQVASDLTYGTEGHEHGYYRLEVPAGKYRLSASLAPGDDRNLAETWFPEAGSLRVYEYDSRWLDDVYMERNPGTIRGLVTDELGNPLDGVEVMLTDIESDERGWAQSGPMYEGDETAPGEFQVAMKPGSYRIDFSGARVEGELTYGDVTYRDGDAVTVESRETVTLDPVALPVVTQDVHGTVRDAEGNPLDGVVVEVFADDGETPVASELTYADPRESGPQHGFFGIELRPGHYRVEYSLLESDDRALQPSAYNGGHYFYLSGGESKYLGAKTLYPENGSLSGRVLNEHEAGVNGVRVEFYNEDRDVLRYAWTHEVEGQSGYYERALRPGDWTVTYDPSDIDDVVYERSEYDDGNPVTVTTGENRVLDDVVLTEVPTATVTGLVTDLEGVAIEGASVTLYAQEGDGFDSVDYATTVGEGDDVDVDLLASHHRDALDTTDDAPGTYRFDLVRKGRTYTVGAYFDGQERFLGDTSDISDATTFEIPGDASTVELDDIEIPAACRGKIVSNGTVSLGVNCLGQMNLNGVGVRFDETGNDGTVAGCECEGWGVADATSGSRGYANNSSGTGGLELESFSVSPDGETATSVTIAGGTFRVTHEYTPSRESDNVYDVNVSVENLTDEPVDLRYRRVMDWDVEPTAFDEYVTMETGTARELVHASNGGFSSADPLTAPDTASVGEYLVGDFVDAGPDDHGALFDFQFPELAPGETQRFQTFYGAAEDEQGALAGLAAVQAEAYSLGQPSTEDGPTLGTPNTFLFGFAGVGGGTLFEPPVAGDDAFDVVSGEETELDVLANDDDPNPFDVLTVVSHTNPAHGSLSCDAEGCTYTSATGYTGTDTFDYVVSDGAGGTDTGTVTLTVFEGQAAQPTGAPVVTGNAKVGGLLSTTDGSWSRSGLDFTYQWLRNGVPIPGANGSTYVPVAGDKDQAITSRVTATRSGAAAVSQDSEPVSIGQGAAPVSTAGSGPTIPASIKLGDRVTAQPGAWTPTADRFTYQWMHDGAPIPGATSQAHIVRVGETGLLSVTVKAHRAGHAVGSAVSNQVDVALGDAARNWSKPEVRGVAAIGQTLTSTPGSWSVPLVDLTLERQWNVDGVPVPGAHGEAWTPGAGDVANGDEITVTVRAARTGHETGTATSDPVVVGAVAGDNTALPQIDGVARVGETLTLTEGTWDSDVDLTHAWFAVPYWDTGRVYQYRLWEFDGADEITVPSWASGYRIFVRETAAGAPGTAPVTVESPMTDQIADIPTLYYNRAPAITGEGRVGSPMSVDTGTWIAYGNTGSQPVTPDSFDYQWYVDGVPVSRAATYTPVAADGGKQLYVALTAHEPAHRDGYGYAWLSRIRHLDEGTGMLDLTVKRATAPRNAVRNASVSVCATVGYDCQWFTTNSEGKAVTADGQPISLLAVPAGTKYDVRIDPSYDSGLLSTTQEVTVVRDQTRATLVELESLTPMPDTAEISSPNGEREVDTDGDGTPDGSYPSVFYSTEQQLSIEGCAGIEDPTWTVEFAHGGTPMSGEMTEVEPGYYTGTIPGFSSTGLATIRTNIPAVCDEEPTEFSIYIDPSGIVADQYGRPIPGAAVTLLHRQGASFVPVPDGSDVMSPANRANPSRTTDTGFFRWDVEEGDYKVQVSDASSNGGPCATTTTNAMSVPPERVDLLIKVACATAPKPTPTVAPELSGTPTVGQTLSVTSGSWSDGIETTGIEWLRDGTVVGTGSTYTLVAGDAGKQVTARVTARRPDYVQENGTGTQVTFDPTSYDVSSAIVQAAGGGGGGGGGGGAVAPTNTTPPSVNGTAKVGSLLTANPGAWSVDGLSFGYQWLRDGEPIAGATSADYRPVAGDLGKAVAVKVTTAKTGLPAGTATSPARTIALGDAPLNQSPPLVNGDPEPGEELSVSNGTWSLADLTYTQQWLRDGEPISGATGPTYTVTEADRGSTLAARVTAAKAGHADGTALSDVVMVPTEEPGKAATATRARLVDPTIRKNRRGQVVVRVTSPAVDAITGAVALKVDGRTVRSVELVTADGGKLRVRLPQLAVGDHKVRAVFAGTDELKRSRSDVSVLTVRKARKAGKHGDHRRPLPSLL